MRTWNVMLAAAAAAFLLPAAASAQSPAMVARGAAIYGSQCARCHNLRSPTEYGDQDWYTIIAQMRARANLTRAEGNAVLAFVQAMDGSRNPAPVSAAQPAPQTSQSRVRPATPPASVGAGRGIHMNAQEALALRRYLAQLSSDRP